MASARIISAKTENKAMAWHGINKTKESGVMALSVKWRMKWRRRRHEAICQHRMAARMKA
jgi:hypothetical protein